MVVILLVCFKNLTPPRTHTVRSTPTPLCYTSGAGTAYTSGTHQLSHPVFSSVRVAWSLVFCVFICRLLFVEVFLFFFCPMYCLSFNLLHCITLFVSLIWSRSITSIWIGLIYFFKTQIIRKWSYRFCYDSIVLLKHQTEKQYLSYLQLVTY
jgi:hypothetical protein